MFEVNLSIQTPSGNQSAILSEKLSVGRTDQADLALPDGSLSRLHATFERHGSDNDEVWVYDENSMNGTFVNGQQISANGMRLNNGDEVHLGSNTRIVVEVQSPKSKVQSPNQQIQGSQVKNQKPKNQNLKNQQLPPVLMIAGGLTLGILLLTIVGVLVVRSFSEGGKTQPSKNPQSPDIPVAIVDPLKGDPDDLDDIFEAFEVQEDMKAENIDDVKSTEKETADLNAPNDPAGSISLNVTRSFWEQQKEKALAPRSGPTGETPPGLSVPSEIVNTDRAAKQVKKLGELINVLHYQQPMDFGDLAQKRLNKELIELPMATESFYLEVGSSASEDEFTAFDFDNGNTPISSGSAKLQALQKLAANFSGQVYDLSKGSDRKQMRIRLLRMFNPRALPILKELGDAYQKKFNRPLRVTSLTRSMDYQIALNKVNPNSFKVRGAGSLPPHTSGCAFDLGRKHMSAEEQNFVMAKLAEMENRGILDALIEYHANACFHTFIYPDGKPPK